MREFCDSEVSGPGKDAKCMSEGCKLSESSPQVEYGLFDYDPGPKRGSLLRNAS